VGIPFPKEETPSPFAAQGLWELEALLFAGMRIEYLHAFRSSAPDFGHVVYVETSAFIQGLGMTQHVPAPCLVHVQADRLPADRTLGGERILPAATQHLQSLSHP
jgi:hypothetical protein